LCQNGRGGGAVTGNVGSLGSNFLDQLCTHVFKLVFQFDFFCNGYAVLGDQRSSKRFVDNYITALGAKSDFYGIGEDIHALQDGVTAFLVKLDDFCSH